jgi:4-amino-4-deoxy-L-arabinose transferase-like glycosyltransferase
MNDKFYSFFARYGLLIVLIIAIFFRFYNLAITPPGLYPDEAMDGTNAQEALATGNFKVFYPENNGREGLFINIQAIFIKFLGSYPWVLRSVSAIFGVFTVLGIYLLIQCIFRKKTYSHFAAFLSSFFTAINFWHINFSRISFRAIMAPAFLIWGIYLLIRSLETLKEPNYKTKKFLWLSVIGGAIYGLGMHSYIAYRATPLLIIFVYLLYLWLYKINFKKLFLGFIVFVITSLAVFSPLGIYFIKNPQDFFGRTSELSITASASPLKDLALNTLKTLAMFDFKGDYNWRHNYSGAPEIFWFVGIFLIIGIFLTPFYVFKKKNPEEKTEVKFIWLLAIAWLVIAMLPVVISNEGIPHALRSILMIPAVFILAGIGAMTIIPFIYQKTKPTIICFGLIVISLALIAQAYVGYFILWAQNPNVADAFNQNYAKTGNQLNALPQAIKKYVVVNAGGVLVRGIPMPSQTVMFITDTFTPEKQKEKNIYYILPGQESQIKNSNTLLFYLETQ